MAKFKVNQLEIASNPVRLMGDVSDRRYRLVPPRIPPRIAPNPHVVPLSTVPITKRFEQNLIKKSIKGELYLSTDVDIDVG
jgi:hypothetical protein